ncbi:response regulator [Bradyrhizobium mercantei]|uniref:response regulator n=1 Tax=Bradyrhizobium mercantei TaxID=1904807 RepID=UPI00097844FC|nr:response regulator [Bradyrhizobium mercantei]
MRVLLVEDKTEFAQLVEKAVRSIPDCELVWCASRDSALARLAAESFDLVVLDRRIPSMDDVLDDHADHGWRVFQHVRENLPGTPVWFLTGSEDADFVVELNNEFGRTADVHGRRQNEQMYQVCWKKRISECVKRLRDFAEHRAILERIAVNSLGGSPVLTVEEYRTLRMFGRQRNGAVVDCVVLGGGLSSSRVLKVVVKEANGAVLLTAVAKVAPLPVIRDEAERYQNHITRLAPGGFPPLTERIEVGAGNTGAIFYGMVGAKVQSLFERLAGNHPETAELPARLRALEHGWYQGKQTTRVRVGQIRRRFIGDPQLPAIENELDGIDTTAVEDKEINVSQCCQHGDFHCANVVFDETDRAMVIDFGDVGGAVSAIDPVTLELSTVFHTQHTSLPADWPTEAHMTQWVDVERYVEGCAFGPFIRGCRAWALAEAASEDEVIAVAYGYALRQLKYADTDKALARALIRACIARLAR